MPSADAFKQIGGGFAAAVPVVLQLMRLSGSARRRLKEDLALLASMPEDSEVRAKWEEHITRSVTSLVRAETEMRRDPMGIGVAIALLVIAGGAVWGAVTADESWVKILLVVVSFTIGLLGVVGMSVSLPRRHRDEKGTEIK